MRILCSAVAAALLFGSVSRIVRAADVDAPDDRFIAGYASAVLEHDFHLPPGSITVTHGAIQVRAKNLGEAVRAPITTALRQIPGVTDVQIIDADAAAPATKLPQDQPANAPVPGPAGKGVETKIESRPWTLLSPLNVFQPLVADPRWPNFSAAYERYTNSKFPKLADVGSVSFGESLSLYQTAPKPTGQFELGVQAAVFAIFDLNSDSKDLVNADYFVGPILEYRNGDFSGFLRVFHQSSHLGDEFLLANPGIRRVNLSYEEVDAIGSYDFFDKTLRLYGGAGYLVDKDPSDLKPIVVQYGVEYRGPRIFPSVGMIPIAAVDLQNHEQDQWSLDISGRAGVQFEDPATLSRKVQLLIEYYNGHSPNGQFYNERIQYIGLGLHFYL